MCGRYVTVTKIKEIEKRFGVNAPKVSFEANTNVGPGQLAPVITGERPQELQLFRFGFTPSWSKNNKIVINARCEGDSNPDDNPHFSGNKGILEKPMFRKAIRSQRCLVIADAFIEGPKNLALSKPYCVYMRNGQRPFAMAGIWDTWHDTHSGKEIQSFAILTTAANDLMLRIGHHRCPLILPKEWEKMWMDPSTPLADVTSMMSIPPADSMNAYPISVEIKHPAARGFQLLQPIGERVYKEYDYEIYQDLQLFGMGETPSRNRRNNGQLDLFS
jgi:putative SOS response-associated peptidase YedK